MDPRRSLHASIRLGLQGRPKHARRAGVHVNHPFGPAQLDTVKEEELCLPSNVGTSNERLKAP